MKNYKIICIRNTPEIPEYILVDALRSCVKSSSVVLDGTDDIKTALGYLKDDAVCIVVGCNDAATLQQLTTHNILSITIDDALPSATVTTHSKISSRELINDPIGVAKRHLQLAEIPINETPVEWKNMSKVSSPFLRARKESVA